MSAPTNTDQYHLDTFARINAAIERVVKDEIEGATDRLDLVLRIRACGVVMAQQSGWTLGIRARIGGLPEGTEATERDYLAGELGWAAAQRVPTFSYDWNALLESAKMTPPKGVPEE